jgi:hypothetical protein
MQLKLIIAAGLIVVGLGFTLNDDSDVHGGQTPLVSGAQTVDSYLEQGFLSGKTHNKLAAQADGGARWFSDLSNDLSERLREKAQ